MPKCERDCFNCPYDDCIAAAKGLTEAAKAYKRAYNREWSAKHRKRIEACRRERYANDADYREHIKQRSRAFYYQHREEILAQKREYYAKKKHLRKGES